MGMSSREWSRYMHDVIGLPGVAGGDQRRGRPAPAGAIRGRAAAHRRRGGGRRRLAASFRLGLASSSNRAVIETVLADLRPRPALRRDRLVGGGRSRQACPGRLPRGCTATRRWPERCAAVEDSGNGIRAAHAAGMRVIAIPNRRYPPTAERDRARRRRRSDRSTSSPPRPSNDEGAPLRAPSHVTTARRRASLLLATSSRRTRIREDELARRDAWSKQSSSVPGWPSRGSSSDTSRQESTLSCTITTSCRQ